VIHDSPNQLNSLSSRSRPICTLCASRGYSRDQCWHAISSLSDGHRCQPSTLGWASALCELIPHEGAFARDSRYLAVNYQLSSSNVYIILLAGSRARQIKRRSGGLRLFFTHHEAWICSRSRCLTAGSSYTYISWRMDPACMLWPIGI
jgi:hypothetical protein